MTSNQALAESYERKADKAFYEGLLALVVGYMLATIWIYDGSEDCSTLGSSWFGGGLFCRIYKPLGTVLSPISDPINFQVMRLMNDMFQINMNPDGAKFVIFGLLMNIPLLLFIIKLVQNRQLYNKAYDLRELNE